MFGGGFFALLVLGVSLVIVVYASYYIDSEFRLTFYIGLIFIFMVSIVGLLYHGNWVVAILR